MKISPTSYIREYLEPNIRIGELNNFTLYVIHGIENFNLKEVWKPVVNSSGSIYTGNHWSTFEEAVAEGMVMLKKSDEDWKGEMERFRKLYEPE